MSVINSITLYVPDPTKGRPLFYGQIYVGEPDLDPEIPANQKQLNVLQEDGSLTPVSQPFILSAGGTPVYEGSNVQLDTQGNYSIKVLDKNGDQIYYIPNANEYLNTGEQTFTISESQVTLADGQLVVDLNGANAEKATIFVSKDSGDRGRLIKGEDYEVTGTEEITLFESYEAGTIIIAQTSIATSSSDEFVKRFDTVDEAITDPRLEDGNALNLKEIESGDGQSSMWDAVLASTVTINGDNIRQCTGNAGLAIVRRNYLPDAASDPFKRSLVYSLGFIDTAYEYLASTYGYSQIYPQGIAIDKGANELFLSRGVADGSNSWNWIWVYDLDTGAFKSVFTLGESLWESISIRYESGVRYFYAIREDRYFIRADVTTTPSSYVTIPTSDVYDLECQTNFTQDEQSFYVSYRSDYSAKGSSHKRAYRVFDSDFNKTGDIKFSLLQTGTFGEDIEDFPKAQSLTLHKGKFYCGVGRIYRPAYGEEDAKKAQRLQGLTVSGINGTFETAYVCKPMDFISKMEGLVGHDVTLTENEGLYSTGDDMYGLWVTLATDEWTDPNFAGKGIAITLEMSNRNERVDFSEYASGLYLPFNEREFESAIHYSDTQLRDPVKQETLDTVSQIMDMMRDSDLDRYSFSGDNQVVIDNVSNPIPTDGNIIEVKSLDGNNFVFAISGPATSTEYWFDINTFPAQVIKNISFT